MKSGSLNIFILIDALGWDYLKDRPFLDDLAVTKRPVKSILGFSSGIIPSILTGRHPQEHKHWSLFFYSPTTSPFRWTKGINWLPKQFLNLRIMRKIVEEISKKLMGYTGYFETYLIPVEQLHLYDISEKRNIYEPKGIRNSEGIFDRLEKNQVDYKCYHYPLKDEEVFKCTEADLKQGKKPFYFLYLSEPDSLLHKSCDNKEDVDLMLLCYEAKIRKLYQLAMGKCDEVNLYVFSDHGMACVDKSYDLKKDIDELGLKAGLDYIPFYDSTMARFWFSNPKAKTAIFNLLKNKNYGRILSERELEEFGANFLNNMYGEVIFLMNTGSVIKPSFMGNTAPRGMHGFDVNDGRMDAVLISNVEIKQEVRDVRGFFQLMSQAAGRPLTSPGAGRPQVEKKIKILYFLNSILRAGVEGHVLELLRHIDKGKFEQILVCPRQLIDLMQEDLDKAQVRYYPVCIRRWRNLIQIIKFLNILKSERPDIVHSHLFFATMFASPLAKLAGVPKVIETSHLREAWRKGLKKAYFVDRFFYAFVDRIIAVSDAVKIYLVNEKKIEAEKITVIHNGVDLEKFKPSKQGESPLPSTALRAGRGESLRLSSRKEFTVGVIGRLEPQKGHVYLLEAIALLNSKLANAEVHIIGEGSLTESLKLKVKQLKLEDKVKFMGFKEDIVSALRELDAVILPSLFEGFPLTVLEAGAMGKAVIATNVDGTPEAIINHRTGILVPPANSQALKAAISLFLDDPAMVVELGRNAANHITANFSLNEQVTKTEQLYLSAVNKAKK